MELSIHGSRPGLNALLEACMTAGARMAEPGEFTMRAFLNGRLDLSQAEAVRDTVEAQTNIQLRAANRQRSGGLSSKVSQLRARLTALLATVEAHVDFSEELGDLNVQDFGLKLASIRSELEQIRDLAKVGRILREGYKIAILGPPNAGKSSLLNALLGAQRAIVTPIAGTTRDTLEEALDFDGLKVVITDTAGIRQTEDVVESIGIERALATAADADHVWLIYDSSQGWTEELEQLRAGFAQITTVLANKSDLPGPLPQSDHFRISCATGDGIQALTAHTRNAALSDEDLEQPAPSPRHLPYLTAALDAVDEAVLTVAHDRPSDLLSVCLGQAIHELGGITGETVGADLLERIFHDFCIGK